MIRILLLTAVLILFAGCAPKYPVAIPPHEPQPGAFFSSQGDPVDETEIIASLESKEFILIGESHDNACDHRVQALILEILSSAGHEVVLGLEMVDVERQGVLDKFNSGSVTVDELPDRLNWDENWGFDFELYRPIFETANRYSIPVAALNLPSRVTRIISRHGLDHLDSEDRAFLPKTLIDPPEEQMQMLGDQFELHSELIQAEQAKFKRFVAAQSAWDTKMAYEAIRHHELTQRPVVILAGTAHVDLGQGIEYRIRALRPESRIASLVPVRSTEDISSENTFSYYCPATTGRMRLGIVAVEHEARVMITGVVQGSLAMESGLEKGDIIVRAAGEDVSSLADLHRAGVQALNENSKLILEVLRDGRPEVFDIVF